MQISYLPTWTTVMPLRAPRETVTNACVPQFLQTASLRHDCGPLFTFGGACLTIPAYGLFIQHHGSSPHVTPIFVSHTVMPFRAFRSRATEMPSLVHGMHPCGISQATTDGLFCTERMMQRRVKSVMGPVMPYTQGCR